MQIHDQACGSPRIRVLKHLPQESTSSVGDHTTDTVAFVSSMELLWAGSPISKHDHQVYAAWIENNQREEGSVDIWNRSTNSFLCYEMCK